jgi:hypothetical protein
MTKRIMEEVTSDRNPAGGAKLGFGPQWSPRVHQRSLWENMARERIVL